MDPQRMTVDHGVLHHAVTPLWEDRSKAWIAQWFSDNGYARAYGSNPANWSGLINPFTGARSYTQTHAVGQRVTGATPDATDAERALGYRVFYIVANPTQVITWHAGDWTMNRRSIAIENLGDYRNYALRDGDMKAIADFYRPLDRAVGGNFAVVLHNEVYATACPARIAEGRNQIVEYINNPPQPPKPQTPTWNGMQTPRKMLAKAGGTNLVEIKTGAVVKSYSAGTPFDFVQASDWNGKTWLRTQSSAERNADTGFDINTLEELPTVEVKDVLQTEEVAYQITKSTDASLPVGQEKVTRKGVKGVRTIVYSVTYTNGVETSRIVKSDSITTPSVTELVSVGSYVEPPVTPPVVPVPEEGEGAWSWLSKVWEVIKKILESFKFKGK